ncbi:MAG: lipoate--protein ligase [Candidatus Izemoplasmatales bacterium]|nr:lipoate--protein ligase [Candidatus Izemoplasmatales bacterium]
MIYIDYPFTETKRLSFYLATEEYLARTFPDDEYFFMWQVAPSVIFGRNQLIENEINMAYVKAHNIAFYRRKSGGGCVYADMSNIMLSFVTPGFHKDFIFTKYLMKVVDALKACGLDAVFSGRNDILVDGMKVSGNAFYRVNHRSIVHGTMLYDTDLEVMVRAITPDNEKLISKGVDSVRQRVMNLKDRLGMSLEDFKEHMRSFLADRYRVLTQADIHAIEAIEETYLNPDFIYGKNPNYSVIRKKKVAAGLIEVSFELKNEVVKNINMLGDYFLIGDPDVFLNKLKGVRFSRLAFQEALEGMDLSEHVFNLSLNDFLEIVF